MSSPFLGEESKLRTNQHSTATPEASTPQTPKPRSQHSRHCWAEGALVAVGDPIGGIERVVLLAAGCPQTTSCSHVASAINLKQTQNNTSICVMLRGVRGISHPQTHGEWGCMEMWAASPTQCGQGRQTSEILPLRTSVQQDPGGEGFTKWVLLVSSWGFPPQMPPHRICAYHALHGSKCCCEMSAPLENGADAHLGVPAITLSVLKWKL